MSTDDEIINLFGDADQEPGGDPAGALHRKPQATTYSKALPERASLPTSAPRQQEASSSDEPEDPRYAGKSKADIIKMHQNIQQLQSRTANELHEYKLRAEKLIESQITQKVEPEAPAVTYEELVDDPATAVYKAVDNSPRLRALEEKLSQTEQQREEALRAESKNRLLTDYPQAFDVVTSNEFLSWVNSNPRRAARFAAAEQALDFDELYDYLDMYKDVSGSKTQHAGNAAASALSAPKGGTAVAKASGQTAKGKYKRSDLQRLAVQDPARYKQMGKEITAAWREGRVINDVG